MDNLNLNELLSLADYRIAIAKQKEAMKQQEEKRMKLIKTEKLALYIQKTIFSILNSIDSYSGTVNDFDEIVEFGVPNKAEWTLDKSKFQMTFDYSYSIYDDELCYNGARGIKLDSIDWQHLCEILSEQNINIQHKKSKIHDDIELVGVTKYADLLVITVERSKKRKNTNTKTRKPEVK